MPNDTHTAYLALGSNLGGRLHTMRAAVHRLRHFTKSRTGLPLPSPLAKGGQRGVERYTKSESAPVCDSCIQINLDTDVASLYESDPVGGPPGQGPYLNSVVRISTTLTPHELLDTILSIESDLGRTRSERWEPRIIDIDILLYDDLIINDDRLTVPHPHLHERCFVLEPLAEIASDLVHPVLQVPIADLAQSVRDQDATQCATRVAQPIRALVGWASPTTC